MTAHQNHPRMISSRASRKHPDTNGRVENNHQSTRGNRKVERADNYRLSHQAPGPEEDGTTISLDQIGSDINEVFPSDVLKNSKNYGLKHASTAATLVVAQGHPESESHIWRAVPQGVTTINPGDWVSLSKEYAEEEAQMESAQIISATAKASDLWSEGLLEEWGYQGTTPLDGTLEREGRRKVLESFPAATSERSLADENQPTTNKPSVIQTKMRTPELGY